MDVCLLRTRGHAMRVELRSRLQYWLSRIRDRVWLDVQAPRFGLEALSRAR
jgi:hypothetical protein